MIKFDGHGALLRVPRNDGETEDAVFSAVIMCTKDYGNKLENDNNERAILEKELLLNAVEKCYRSGAVPKRHEFILHNNDNSDMASAAVKVWGIDRSKIA